MMRRNRENDLSTSIEKLSANVVAWPCATFGVFRSNYVSKYSTNLL